MTSTPEHLDNEARLTAYVLGELSAEESADLETAMAADESLRAEVEAIRATTDQLTAALESEAGPGLTDEQRERVTAGVHDGPPIIFTMRRAWAGFGVAAAACLALALWLPTLSVNQPADEFAIADAPAEAPETVRGLARAPRLRTEGRDNLEAGQPLAEGAIAQKERQAGQPLYDRADVAGEALDASAGFKNNLGQPSFGVPVAGSELGGGAPAGGAGGDAGGAVAGRRGSSTVATVQAPAATAPPAPPGRGRAAPASGLGLETASRRKGTTAGGDVVLGATLEREREEDALRRMVDNRLDDQLASEPDADVADFEANREAYGRLVDNPFVRAIDEQLSTFSIDVDTASYANMRRVIDGGRLPVPDAIRIEELINYFDYDYAEPAGEHPFSVNVETNACPWNDAHRLVRVGLKGKDVPRDMRPATNLVFLLDVSGSMNDARKLPLLKQSMSLLVDSLTADDRVAIVVYAGAAGLALPSTYCDDRETILSALENLHAGGSTNGGQGIELAYKTAQDHFIDGGVNRVILCTDGDFNVGVSDEGSLVRLIEAKRETGVFLSVLGFGTGNWQDAKMEALSNKGNGNFAYIDSLDEARKVLVEEMAGTLVTIAKDVKIQVDFNPATVNAYRLIGYANRIMPPQDFNDDTKDAGEIGAGHTVTALYEIVPAGVEIDLPDVDESKYVRAGDEDAAEASDELLTVKLRYKQPEGETSTKLEYPVTDGGAALGDASEDFRFAAAVASFGMVLRDAEAKGSSTYATILDLAAAGLGDDEQGYRKEFVRLVERARELAGN
jgi:Ca-activated chloride channel family protein